MPRIRTIKPEFFGDEKLAPLTPTARLTFIGLIAMADDAGRLVDNTKTIDGFVFPETDDTVAESLDRLAELGQLGRVGLGRKHPVVGDRRDPRAFGQHAREGCLDRRARGTELDRRRAAFAAAQHVQADVGRNPVQP